MVNVTKTIKFNLLQPTTHKKHLLIQLEQQWFKASNHLFETLRYWDAVAPDTPMTRYNLQRLEYRHIKKFTGLQSQIINDIIKDSFTSWINNGKNGIKSVSPMYNIYRSGEFKYTTKGNPVVSITIFNCNNKRIGLPISQDGAWYRFKHFLKDGWKSTSFRLKRYGSEWKILANIKKEFTINRSYDAVIGIDRGSRTLVALSIINKKGKILKQLYFGRDVWNKQRDISIRRSKLSSFADTGNYKAKTKLKQMRHDERNFVKTRCYEIAHQIVKLAKEYNACIAIEDLKGLCNYKSYRKINRKVKRMPYYKFEVALRQIAGQNNTTVVTVPSAYTSQICSRCGNLHKTTNVVFKCPECGYTANRDRNASVNIALVAGMSFFKTIQTNPQISKRYAPVNGHVWKDDGVRYLHQRCNLSPNFK